MSSRHQLEWAVLTIADIAGDAAVRLARSQLKRLWLADRTMKFEGRNSEYPLRRDHAFFDGEMPGKGNAVSYTRHDAYVLCLAFRLLKLGWKPLDIIATCRTFRPALAREYDRLITTKSAFSLGDRELSEDELRKLKDGRFVVRPEQLSWLIITASLQSGLRYETDGPEADGRIRVANVVHTSEKLIQLSANLAATDGHAIVLEICNPALSVDYLLDIAPVVKRGRRPKTAS